MAIRTDYCKQCRTSIAPWAVRCSKCGTWWPTVGGPWLVAMLLVFFLLPCLALFVLHLITGWPRLL